MDVHWRPSGSALRLRSPHSKNRSASGSRKPGTRKNKALLALTAIRMHGFSESESTRRAMDDFRQTTDPLAVWLDRNTVVHPTGVVVADRLWTCGVRTCGMRTGLPTQPEVTVA